MTVLFFARLFYPHIGGVEKHVLEVGRRLVKKGHKVTVITENYQSLSAIDNIEGIKIIRVKVGSNEMLKKFRIWLALVKHIYLIKNADIIHCHDIFFWYLPFKLIFPTKKVYTTFHGYEGNKIPGIKAKFMHKIAEKFSNGNICIGNFYKKWYGTKATYISYGAVDKKLIEQGKNPTKPVKDAMFLGRLEDETGIMEYLKAVKELNISLDVFGDGSLEKSSRAFVVKNKLNVNFKGFVSNATDFIKDYKYVFVSRYLGILEAMALKKPVFAVYNNQIKKDYLEFTPFAPYISISKDGEMIYKEIKNYNKVKFDSKVNKAYEWVRNQTWENMTNLYLRLWA